MDDVVTLTGEEAKRAGAVGVAGGFPCQAHCLFLFARPSTGSGAKLSSNLSDEDIKRFGSCVSSRKRRCKWTDRIMFVFDFRRNRHMALGDVDLENSRCAARGFPERATAVVFLTPGLACSPTCSECGRKWGGQGPKSICPLRNSEAR